MKIEKFTDKAREAIHTASELAKKHSHSQIEIEHLLEQLVILGRDLERLEVRRGRLLRVLQLVVVDPADLVE